MKPAKKLTQTHLKNLLRTTLGSALAAVFVAPAAQADSLSIKLTLPRMQTSEYHRPYVAVWLENTDRSVVRDLAVWYDHAMARDEGKKWLKDIRRWWRVSGRNQTELADGVTGATRAPGTHTLNVALNDARLAGLPAGSYELAVEASREKGGLELIRLPLAWPLDKAATVQASGKTELGAIAVSVVP